VRDEILALDPSRVHVLRLFSYLARHRRPTRRMSPFQNGHYVPETRDEILAFDSVQRSGLRITHWSSTEAAPPALGAKQELRRSTTRATKFLRSTPHAIGTDRTLDECDGGRSSGRDRQPALRTDRQALGRTVGMPARCMSCVIGS
jgi:hypothetical protein